MGIIDERIAARAVQIRRLEKPNEIQRNFLRLIDLPHRGPNQEKELKSLYRLDAVEVRAAEVRNQAEKFYIEERSRERSERDARLIVLGGYISRSGLEELDDATLLGALLQLAAQMSSDLGIELRRQFHTRGEVALANQDGPKRRRVSIFRRSKW